MQARFGGGVGKHSSAVRPAPTLPYVELCRAQGYFTAAFYQKAAAHLERIHVRRMLRQVTDGRGWPTLANIVRAGDDGRPERVFLQEELFGPEEYLYGY